MTTPPYTDQDLTAFALGELDPAGATHHTIAEALAQDPAIQSEIEAIKQSAQTVHAALAHEGSLPTSRDRQGADRRIGVSQAKGPLPHGRGSSKRPPLFARSALLAAGLALAAGAAITVISLVKQETPTHIAATHATPPRGIDAIYSAMDLPVTASFLDDSIADVFVQVQRATGTDLQVDWDALEARGISKETKITFDADAIPARDLLTLALSAAWQQLPHPDPVVWTVTPTQVRIEARSAVVQRTLDHTRAALAMANTTDARMASNQFALASDASWQQPGEWTDTRWAWNEAERGGQQQGQQQGFGDGLDALGELEISERETLDLASVGLITLGTRVPPTGTQNLSYHRQQVQQQQNQMHNAQHYLYSAVGLPSIQGRLNTGQQLSTDYGTQLIESFATLNGIPARTRGVIVLGEGQSEFGRSLGVLAGEVSGIQAGSGVVVLQEQIQQQQAQQQPMRQQFGPYLTRDTYALVNDNPFRTGLNDPLSTFSVDVDTAAYAIVRRQLEQQHQAPVPGAVRIEELINYFEYDYAAPLIERELLDHGVVTQASIERLAADDDSFAPFATHIEVTDCPWAEGHQLVRIGIKGMEVAQEDRPAAHLTFLLDVSGSMNRDNKLPLVKESLTMLLGQLNAQDHVSIVVYAGAAGVVLENASAADIPAIESALEKLSAGGSTAGGQGIELAYDIAQRHYIVGGVNRVILCTDGDFNVGISDRDQLVDLIQDKANPQPNDDGEARGVYLSALGFGFGNLNDNMMEPLTNAGNGNYAYIDTADEAHKVMVEQVGGTLVTIAKDVKIQVEFNPANVLAYRLIGYENRILAAEDFANDTVDAGDIGAGHTVTALYEIVPFDDDGLDDAESLRMVKEQIEALDDALAFSVSVLENTPLTQEQYQKLVGSVRMMQQQRDVALAVQSRAKRSVPAALTDGIEMRYRNGDGFIDGLDAMEELLVVNLRYKPVDAPAEQGTSRLIQTTVDMQFIAFDEASDDTRFAAAVAGFGMVLRNSPHRGDADYQWVLATAGDALGDDTHGYRAGFVSLVEQAATIAPLDSEKERNVIGRLGEREFLEARE